MSSQTTASTGWAVVVNGAIDIDTVSETRRAAIVNWLVRNGRPVYIWTTDAEIERAWDAVVEGRNAGSVIMGPIDVVRVTVTAHL
jgi:hypothetical protein